MSRPIEDYGIIGNAYTAALVSRGGSIDWLCLPRFDSESVFAALLGETKHGSWLLAPQDPEARCSRAYRGETGILETPADVGGWPEYKAAAIPADTDKDGMPDEWETKHGLNPKNAADAAEDADGDGYTNVEEYLNDTDPRRFVDYTRAENNVNPFQTKK